MDHDTFLHILAMLDRWRRLPPEPPRCPACGQETGDTPSLTRWPQQTRCPHCGADLCPF